MLRSVGYPYGSGYTTTIVGLQTGGKHCLAVKRLDTYLFDLEERATLVVE